jgi:hypothetical protein
MTYDESSHTGTFVRFPEWDEIQEQHPALDLMEVIPETIQWYSRSC